MTQQRTYTLIERDFYGATINTITGLGEQEANLVEAALRRGDAYTDKLKPWTCEVVREPTREEQLAAVVDEWIAGGKTLKRADHLVACLRRVAEALEPLGDREIPGTGLEIVLSLWSSGGEPDRRMAVVDELASLFGMTAQMPESGHYGSGSTHGSGLRLVTIVKPEPKPLVSDETIRQAEQVDAPKPVDGEAVNAPGPIAAERVDEILAELNRLTAAGDNWWDWIDDQPEFDPDATAAAVDTEELHLIDGTLLVWQPTPPVWKQAKS